MIRHEKITNEYHSTGRVRHGGREVVEMLSLKVHRERERKKAALGENKERTPLVDIECGIVVGGFLTLPPNSLNRRHSNRPQNNIVHYLTKQTSSTQRQQPCRVCDRAAQGHHVIDQYFNIYVAHPRFQTGMGG